nr:hypothetical protein Iba_chr12fCG12040 [Ipomoea batatas]
MNTRDGGIGRAVVTNGGNDSRKWRKASGRKMKAEKEDVTGKNRSLLPLLPSPENEPELVVAAAIAGGGERNPLLNFITGLSALIDSQSGFSISYRSCALSPTPWPPVSTDWEFPKGAWP